MIKPVTQHLPGRADLREAIETVAKALEALRFGSIQVVVHDGRVVQVDVTERRRFS